VTYLGRVVVFVVDLAGSVRIRQVSRRKVEQREVEALSWVGDQLDGTRRDAVGQRAEAVRRQGARRVAVGQDRHSATASDTACRPAAEALRHCAPDVAQLGGDRLFPGVQTLVVVR